MIKMLVFDIDGVISDGRRYTDGGELELKTIQLKDLDAIGMLADSGYKLGCISGEDTEFSRQFARMKTISFVKLGCKDKKAELQKLAKDCRLQLAEICYIGDGKYDIPALQSAGLAVCPNDAIEEVKEICDIVLRKRGGEGCIAECCSILLNNKETQKKAIDLSKHDLSGMKEIIKEHQNIIQAILDDKEYLFHVEQSIRIVADSYRKDRKLFIYGNSLAQYLAAELMKCFWLGRKAWSPEILMNSVPMMKAFADSHGCDCAFAQEIEARVRAGDVLLGITTGEIEKGICEGFRRAKKIGAETILMADRISRYLDIFNYIDCMINIPSRNQLRTEEIHMLTGHLICEGVKYRFTK